MSVATLDPRDLAGFSANALSESVTRPELFVAGFSQEAVWLGAFQRTGEVPAAWGGLEAHLRGSGGGAVRVGPGRLYAALRLPSPGALVPATEAQILNRAVRPVLRALTKAGVLTHYFGRDTLVAKGRPVAHVSFAHDASTGNTLVEAIVAVSHAALDETRAAYEGKVPATLEELRGAEVDPGRIAGLLADAYGLEATVPSAFGARSAPCAVPWAAKVDEAIGPIFAGHDEAGCLRVGGELMVSRDRLGWLEERVQNANIDALDALVDEALTAPRTALFGVRRLGSVRDALATALGA
ncbi:MAG: hypothetical protein U0183_32185 [Polyangiaceae bacterium]